MLSLPMVPAEDTYVILSNQPLDVIVIPQKHNEEKSL